MLKVNKFPVLWTWLLILIMNISSADLIWDLWLWKEKENYSIDFSWLYQTEDQAKQNNNQSWFYQEQSTSKNNNNNQSWFYQESKQNNTSNNDTNKQNTNKQTNIPKKVEHNKNNDLLNAFIQNELNNQKKQWEQYWKSWSVLENTNSLKKRELWLCRQYFEDKTQTFSYWYRVVNDKEFEKIVSSLVKIEAAYRNNPDKLWKMFAETFKKHYNDSKRYATWKTQCEIYLTQKNLEILDIITVNSSEYYNDIWKYLRETWNENIKNVYWAMLWSHPNILKRWIDELEVKNIVVIPSIEKWTDQIIKETNQCYINWIQKWQMFALRYSEQWNNAIITKVSDTKIKVTTTKNPFKKFLDYIMFWKK